MQAAAGALIGMMVAVCLLPSVRLRGGDGQTVSGLALWPVWRRIAVVGSSSAAAGVVAWRIDTGVAWLAFVLFASAAPVLAAIDIAVRRLPFWLTIPIAAIGLGGFAIDAIRGSSVGPLIRAGIAAVAVGAVFLILALISRGGLGGGDVVLAAVVALYLGWLGWSTVAVGLMFGLVTAAMYGVIHGLMARSMRARFPLGPFLLAGWLAGVLYGA